MFYGELSEGKCHTGTPRKHLKDQLKYKLTAAGIPETSPETGLHVAGEKLQRGAQEGGAAEEKCRWRKALTAQSPPAFYKDSYAQCVPKCAIQGSAFIITRGTVDLKYSLPQVRK